MKKIAVLVFIASLVLAALACGSDAASTVTSGGAATTAAEPTSAPALAIGKIGDRVESGGVALSVNSVKAMTNTGLVDAETGKIYLVVDVTIENTGRDASPYNPLYFKLKDADGFEYNITIVAPDPSLKSGDLAQGEKSRGNVAFEIPIGAKGLILSYEPLVFAGGYEEIRFDLGDTPAP